MTANSFAVPQQIEGDLVRVRTYWQGLIRGDANMPYWDDVKPHELRELRKNVMLIDVFPDPLRFRFRMVGEQVTQAYGKEIANKFSDEIEPHSPLDRLDFQCAAAVEKSAPAYYRNVAALEERVASSSYSRLVLPMWGNGRIEMLLGAIVWSRELDAKVQD